MVLITADNSCYYNCTRFVGGRPIENVKRLPEITNIMKSELTDDFIKKQNVDITNVFSKKREELAKTNQILEIANVLNQSRPTPASVPVPAPAPVPVPVPVVGRGIEDINEETKQIKHDVMKKNSKSIIERLLKREKNTNQMKNKNNPIKITNGGGLMEI